MNADLSLATAKIAYESRKRCRERQQQQQQLQYQASNNGTANEQMDTTIVAEPLNQKLASALTTAANIKPEYEPMITQKSGSFAVADLLTSPTASTSVIRNAGLSSSSTKATTATALTSIAVMITSNNNSLQQQAIN